MDLHSPVSTPSDSEDFPKLQPPAKQQKGNNTPYIQPIVVKSFPKRDFHNLPAEVIDRRRKSIFQNLIHNSTFTFGNVHLENQNFVFTYEGNTYTFTPKVHLVEKLHTLKKNPINTNSVPTLITPMVTVVSPPPPTPDSHSSQKQPSHVSHTASKQMPPSCQCRSTLPMHTTQISLHNFSVHARILFQKPLGKPKRLCCSRHFT